MVTNETRRGWLAHALEQGDQHLMVPVADYEEVLEILETADPDPWWARWLIALWWIVVALALGYGALRTVCR